MNRFDKLKSRRDLARFLKTDLEQLTFLLYKNGGVDYFYETFEIPKKSGGTRIINAPTKLLKRYQKNLAKELYEFQGALIENNNISSCISHGFEKNKNIMTNAKVHKNKKYVLSLDFEDFFGSFHFGRVRGYFEKNRNLKLSKDMATILAQLVCYQGKLPQGAPTSPIIANLICNIFDMRLCKIVKKFKVDYTRYADDLTFSTNNSMFINEKEHFLKMIYDEVSNFGLKINQKKTRLSYKRSRQQVTGIIVNKKLNVRREYYKTTRAMADCLYKKGEFIIDGKRGGINQLDGRFAYINQVEQSNYNNSNKDNFKNLNSKGKQYQKFLFYKYFFCNEKPLIVTEGKTDIKYIKAALKKYYNQYPLLIEKNGDEFKFKVSFLRREGRSNKNKNEKKKEKPTRLETFLGIFKDGADCMVNIYYFYTGGKSLSEFFLKKSNSNFKNPVILIFDNEQKNRPKKSKKPLKKSKKPLKKFLEQINIKEEQIENFNKHLYTKIIENLYLLTNPLVGDKEECEIEDLFDDETLNHKIEGKKFSKNSNNKETCSKNDFSKYILKNYENINFEKFKPMLNALNEVVKDYSNKQK